MWKIGLWLWKSPSCKPSLICDIPLVRGNCVEIPLVRGDSGGCVGIPLSEEVELWLYAYPSFVMLIIVWLSAYPSKCRGDLFCALSLVRGCIG